MREEANRGRIAAAAVLIGCLVMVWVEGVWQPVYLYKSMCKVAVLLFCMGGYSLITGDWSILKVFRVKNRKALFRTLILGIAVYAGILVSYYGMQPFIDFQAVTQNLIAKENISARNFIYVAIYISICNSLLEELFFRGFAFLKLRKYWGEKRAQVFSALTFAGYHILIMSGWFSIAMLLFLIAALALSGVLFNLLDRNGTIYNSWIVHMTANLAINTIGLMMFGII